MLPYDSLFDKEFRHLLVQELSPSHEFRLKYSFGLERIKSTIQVMDATSSSTVKLDVHPVLKTPLNDPIDLYDLIDLPDPKLNADRLSLNPKLNDLICYDNRKKKRYRFDFYPNPLTAESEPYFIYAQDKYKRHHVKHIHFHAVSRFYGMYKDSKYKYSCSSECHKDFDLEILHNHELGTPELTFTPLIFDASRKHDTKVTNHQQMMLMIELDKTNIGLVKKQVCRASPIVLLGLGSMLHRSRSCQTILP